MSGIPRKLGKYDIVRAVGKGAMGIVYEGFDPLIERTVAIKTIRRDELDPAEAEEHSRRFLIEARAAGKLHHPQIVGLYDHGEEQGLSYIVMEFVRGRELKSYFDARHAFALHQTVRLMGELLDALGYSHGRGVIHRDVKPANIFVTESGGVKLGDFGIARIDSTHKTHAGTVLGTPSYMAPEQIRGEPADARADLYAAGVVLYQFLAGERPFTGSMVTVMQKVLNEPPPPPSRCNPGLSGALDALVLRALAKDAAQRFQSAAEFRRALVAAAGLAEGDGADDDAEGTVLLPAGRAVRLGSGSERAAANAAYATGTGETGVAVTVASAADPVAAARARAAQARRRAEEELRLAEEELHRAEEAQRQGDEEARRKAEEEARRKAEEEARRRAEEEARRKAEEEARRKAEEEARRRQAAEALQRAVQDDAGATVAAQCPDAAPAVAPASAAAAPARTQPGAAPPEGKGLSPALMGSGLAALAVAGAAAWYATRPQPQPGVPLALAGGAASAPAPDHEGAQKDEDAARRQAAQAAQHEAAAAAQRRRQAEEEARQRAEADARRQADEDSRRRADAEARRKTEEDARRKADDEARRKADEEARRKADEDARRKADAEARRKADEEARRKVAADKAAADRAAAEKAAADRVAADRVAADRAAAERAAADKAAAERVAVEKVAAEKAAAERAAAERAVAERAVEEARRRSPAELYREGVELLRAGRGREAARLLEQAGNAGHGPASRRLMDLYGNGGSGVSRDYTRAVEWKNKAKAQGVDVND